jgi:hypothetical protein
MSALAAKAVSAQISDREARDEIGKAMGPVARPLHAPSKDVEMVYAKVDRTRSRQPPDDTAIPDNVMLMVKESAQISAG